MESEQGVVNFRGQESIIQDLNQLDSKKMVQQFEIPATVILYAIVVDSSRHIKILVIADNMAFVVTFVKEINITIKPYFDEGINLPAHFEWSQYQYYLHLYSRQHKIHKHLMGLAEASINY